MNAAGLKRQLFLIPEIFIAAVAVPVFLLVRILIEPSAPRQITSLLTAFALAVVISALAGLPFFLRNRHLIDTFFVILKNPDAHSGKERASLVNRLMSLPNHFTLNVALRSTALTALAIGSRLIAEHGHIYDSALLLAQILIAGSSVLFCLLVYQRIIIGNLLNQTRFQNAPVSWLAFPRARNLVSFSVFLAMAFFTGWLILLIRFTGGNSLIQEELEKTDGVRALLQTRLEEHLEVIQADCREAGAMLKREASVDEIRRALQHRSGPAAVRRVSKTDAGLAADHLYVDLLQEDRPLIRVHCSSSGPQLLYDAQAEISSLTSSLPRALGLVLTNHKGSIVYHPDPGFIGKELGPPTSEKPPTIRYYQNNVEYVLVGPHRDQPLSVLLLIDSRQLARVVDALLFYISLAMLPLALLLAGGMHLLLFFNLASVRTLKGQITRLSTGDLQAHIDYITGDDLGHLSMHLNHFVNRLQDVIHQTRRMIQLNLQRNQRNVQLAEESHRQFQNISTTMEQITTAATEIMRTVETVDEKTRYQMGNIDRYMQAIQKLTATTTKMNDTVNQLNTLYNSTRSEATIGRSLLKELKETMRGLDDRASEIAGIVSFINDISKQVHLLALNASIEAARAGEAGRGFSVVADEVSRLADRISQSVKDISLLVQGNHEESQRGLNNATEAARLFNRVLVDMSTVNDVIEEISVTRNELSKTNEFVAEHNHELNDIVSFIYTNSVEQKNALQEIGTGLNNIMSTVTDHLGQNEQIQNEAEALLSSTSNLQEILQFFSDVPDQQGAEADINEPENSK